MRDQNELQRVLDSLSENPREVIIEGRIQIDKPLRLPRADHFGLVGKWATIEQTRPNTPVFIFEGGNTHHFEVSGLTLQAPLGIRQNPQESVGILLDGGAHSHDGFYDATFRNITFLRLGRGISTQAQPNASSARRFTVWDTHFENIKGLALTGSTLRFVGEMGMPGNTFSRISCRQYDGSNGGQLTRNEEPQIKLSAQGGFYADRMTLEGSFGPAFYIDSSSGTIGSLRFEWHRFERPEEEVLFLGGGRYFIGQIDYGRDPVRLSPHEARSARTIERGYLVKVMPQLDTEIALGGYRVQGDPTSLIRLINDPTPLQE